MNTPTDDAADNAPNQVHPLFILFLSKKKWIN